MKNQTITITPENLPRYFSKSYSTCLKYQDEITIEIGKKKGQPYFIEDFNLATCSTTMDIAKYIKPDQQNTLVGTQLVLNFPTALV